MTKVSFIIPVYNVEQYIERCAKSLMEQTLTEVEYIFVDDVSEDRSIDVLNEVLNRCPQRKAQTKIICHERNSGVECAKRTALRCAQGEYILFVDSDDYVDLDFAEQMYAEAKRINADIVISDVALEKKGKASQILHDYLSSNPKDWFKDMLEADKTLGFMCSKMYRRKFIARYMPDEEPRISYLEDISANVRLFYYAERITYLPRAFYHYVFNPQSITKSKENYRRKFQDSEEYFQRTEKFLCAENLINEYAETLKVLRLKMKVHLLFCSDRKVRDEFRKQYPEIDIKNYRNKLKTTQYLMLWLSKNRLHFAASLLIFMLNAKVRLQGLR